MNEDHWLTPAEVAAELKFPLPTLRGWRHRGIGPASVKLGPQTIRYRRSEIDRWVAEQEATEEARRNAA